MRKSVRKELEREAEEKERSHQEYVVDMARTLMGAGLCLRRMVHAVGFEVLSRMLEADREELCGPARKKQPERKAYRHGYDQGQVVLGGRKVSVPKPRVRSVAREEMVLPTWEEVAAEDPLTERTIEQILVGVSTRNYARSLEPLAQASEVGVSHSSVSRRFVAHSKAQAERFLSRPLQEVDFPVIMIDGTRLGEHMLLVALGIDDDGHKHVLGLVEGSSESEAVCRSLLRNLLDRGLVLERARLFVIDGSRGLRKAIRDVFDYWALIQRCQVHKLRNVLEHLPVHKRPWARTAIRKAWDEETQAGAKRRLDQLAGSLDDPHPGAAASLREGLEETLTLHLLGMRGALYRTLCSTNPIENLQGGIKRVARNVKRWRGGSMAVRWGATALADVEKRFRRVKGFRSMQHLIRSLDAQVSDQGLDQGRKIA